MQKRINTAIYLKSCTGLVLGCCLFIQLNAQSTVDGRKRAAEDFKKLNHTYASAGSLSLTVSYRLYQNHESTQPAEVRTGFFKRQGNKVHSKLMEIETMQNEDYMIMVDPSSKILMVTDPGLNTTEELIFDMDSVLSYCSAITFQELKGNNVYKMYYHGPVSYPYTAVEIHINKDSYFMEKLVLYFAEAISVDPDNPDAPVEPPRAEILHSNIRVNPRLESKLFSEKKYVKVKDGELVCSEHYQDYRMINQRIGK